MDPPHRRIVRVDTTAEYAAPAPVGTSSYVRTYTSLTAEPMEAMDFRLAVRNAYRSDEGRVQTGRLTVPDYSAAELRISALVIAEPEAGAWIRGDIGLSPIPTHQIAAGTPFRLYHETYNVEEGDTLTTRIHLEREGGGLLSAIGRLFGGRTEIDLRFDDVAGAPGRFGFQQLREISGDLEPGTYRIKVTVRNAESGETSEGETRLVINPPTGG